MSISLANENPSVEQKGLRANFSWTMTEPWDERRLAAFLMTKHRRSDSDWTRRPSPFFASLGQSSIECSVPVARPDALPELAAILTYERSRWAPAGTPHVKPSDVARARAEGAPAR